jgi:sensor c-di-GMP phosphodiesterase-like protein
MPPIDIDAIRAGLYAGQFFLEYLPTMLVAENRCVGAEALIRWDHPDGLILPDAFIPLIENTPLSGLLTYWVIETVAQELGAWLAAHEEVHISINVPPEVLGRGGLEYATVKAGLGPLRKQLIMEITERSVPDRIGMDALKGYSDFGVRIALDDFGLHDANLLLMSRVQVDIIKTDKRFADQMLEAGIEDRRMQALLTFMRANDFEVIVEGVETAAQCAFLREAGIRMAQGWYYSPALRAEAFQAFFHASR